MDVPPSFRAEIYYLVAKFLENGPCQSAAEALRKDLESHELVPQRYDWRGQGHRKTFKDMEDEFGKLPNEYLLSKCFELCSRLNPGSSSVRSLLKRENVALAKRTNFLQRLSQFQIGLTNNSYQPQWHTQLAKNMKLLRRTFGHLSSVYCLIFDRSGKLVLTGADDMLVKCWSFNDGRLIHTFRGASSEISDLAVSLDNKLLAAGSCDKVIRVWELHTAFPVAVLTKHTGTITAINFCPYLLNSGGNRYLASTSGDGSVSFWRYHYDDHGHTQFDEQPTRYHEKIRPGAAQMICASFSPGGVFFCVGSADHNVRVYQMNHEEGPIRILEEELHDDRVDSIQWCNTPNEIRFLSGSRDGTARIWTFVNRRWKTLVLNMKTGDNQEPLKSQKQTTVVSTSRSGRPTSSTTTVVTNNGVDSDSNISATDPNQVANQNKKMKSVTMVAWSLDDALAITAVSDLTLKIWDSHKGTLLSNLTGHEDEIFVLEPHPNALNLLLTAAHDGQLIVWDLETKKQLFKHRNMIEEQGNTQGHGPVFDAKWSKDGTTICASDSHGHVMFIGHGSADQYGKCPTELFFHTDYRPLLRDSFHNVVDEQTQLPPHLLPPPFLVDSEGDPYPIHFQKLVRGRENMSEREGLVPLGPEPSFQAPHQHQEPQEEAEAPQENEENPEERLNRFRNEMIRNLPSNRQDENQPEEAAVAENENNDAEDNQQGENSTNAARTSKLVILKDTVNAHEIKEKVEYAKASSVLEIAMLKAETQSDGPSGFDHDYSRPSANKKSRSDPRSRGGNNRSRQQGQGQSQSRSRQRRDEEEEEEEEEQEPANNERDEDQTSDCSLDESDFSESDTTTDDNSSEHSDWGSDQSDQEKAKESKETATRKSTRKLTKKKRNAAQKCREKIQYPTDGNTEDFVPPIWLSETNPKKAPYFPQIGDVLMLFKEGYEKYIEIVELRNVYKMNKKEQQWTRRKNLNDATLVKVSEIKFEIRPPRLCQLKLQILDEETMQPTNQHFTIKYHDMNDVVDFMVLYQSFNSYKGKPWKKGDRIRCQIDDCWWKGTVHKVEKKETPFLSIFVHWDNGDKEFLSPWDLEALDDDSMDMKDGDNVTPEQVKKSLYIPTSEEWNNFGRESECMRISEAVSSIMELAIAEPFNYPVDLTQYPEYMYETEYMMDFNMIKARVENHFYRRIDAIKYDLHYIAKNAENFNRPKSDIVKNAKIISKVALEIVGDTSKTKDDVSQIYHRLADNFQWSASEDENDDDDEEEEEEPREKRTRSSSSIGGDTSRRSRKSKKVVSPNTNPKKWKHDCDELLKQMHNLPFSVPFREPVSEIEFPDYHRYINTPMDLTTVKESLHIGDHSDPAEFAKDVRLIFKNSKEYNTDPKSKILAMTHKLENWFEERIGDLIHDWKMTNRRLTMAKRKHKAKKQDKSPVYTGKGKGKGKGQSNNINKRKKNESSEEDEDDNDEDDDEASADEDVDEPKPGPSTRVTAEVSKRSSRSRVAPPLKNAMTASNDGRRTSSRQSRLPLRFQSGGDDDDEEEENEATEENARPKRTTRLKEASPPGAAGTSKAEPETDSEEEAPLASRKRKPIAIPTPVVKEESEEDEPLVRSVKSNVTPKTKKEESDSEDDVPLASRMRPSTSTMPTTPTTAQTTSPKKSSVRHSNRTSRPNRKYEETASEDEVVRRRPKRQRQSSEASSPRRPKRSSGRGQRKNSSRRSTRSSRPTKRGRYDDDDDDDEESQSESDSDTNSEDLTEEQDEESEEAPPPRRRGRSNVQASPPRRLRGSRRAVQDEESEEEVLPQRKRRQQIERSNRNRLASTSSNNPGSSSRGSRKRRSVKRPVYFEGEESDDNTRRSSRRSSKRKKYEEDDDEVEPTEEGDSSSNSSSSSSSSGSGDSSNDSEQDSDASREKAYLKKHKKKATVTSRGRVSKPNPRIS